MVVAASSPSSSTSSVWTGPRPWPWLRDRGLLAGGGLVAGLALARAGGVGGGRARFGGYTELRPDPRESLYGPHRV